MRMTVPAFAGGAPPPAEVSRFSELEQAKVRHTRQAATEMRHNRFVCTGTLFRRCGLVTVQSAGSLRRSVNAIISAGPIPIAPDAHRESPALTNRSSRRMFSGEHLYC